MLTHLSIQNLAITDSLSLDFTKGLSVLTGETGAGKSIIIDAIGLVLGDRSDPKLVKNGAKRADIIAGFNIESQHEITSWLEEHELDSGLDDEKECILKRSLHSNGRSKGFINAQPVPLGLLKQLGEKLISIHGQNSHQQLLKSDNQRVLLDQYAQLVPLNTELNQIYTLWKDKIATYQLQIEQADELEQKKQFLNFQLEELSAFSPLEDEFSVLENEYKVLSHSSQILIQLQQIQQTLFESERFNAESLLASASKDFEELINYDDNLQSIAEMINSALIQLNEAHSEIGDYLHHIDDNPERLIELEERLSQYHEFGRKHQIEPQLLYQKLISLEETYNTYCLSNESQEQLLIDIDKLHANYVKLAKKLSKERASAALKLSTEVEHNIKQLGLSQGNFTIKLIPHENSQEMNNQQSSTNQAIAYKNGNETIHFMVSANPGQDVGPIEKIASGGELSRISLAIQVVTAQYKSTPTLIFDEIDVGVGGKIAEMIGAKLSELGQQSQIFCVTHQAQVAVHGNSHYLVQKSFNETSTSSTIYQLNDKQRIDELSRMLSGAEITETTRLHATEMLQQAQS